MTNLAVTNQQSLNLGNDTLVNDWLKFNADNQASTVKTYGKAIKNFVRFLKDKQIDKPTRDVVVAYRNYIAENFADSTARLYLTSCKNFFRWLASNNLYPNVADNVKGIESDDSTHKKDALSIEDAQKVLVGLNSAVEDAKKALTTAMLKSTKKALATQRACKKDLEKALRDRAVISTMLICGLRTVEVTRLLVSSVEQRRGVYVLMVQGKRKNAKNNAKKISHGVPVVLPRQVKKFIDEYLAFRGNVKRNDFLFVSTSRSNAGSQLQTQSISRLAKQILKADGFDSDRLTAHSLRHTAATVALLAGADIEEVRLTLRHKSINTTSIYRHDLSAVNNSATVKCADSIFSGLNFANFC